jgi:hypothetical protein
MTNGTQTCVACGHDIAHHDQPDCWECSNDGTMCQLLEDLRTVAFSDGRKSRAFIIYLALLAVLVPATLIAYMVGGMAAASLVGQGGAGLVVFGSFLYVVVWDSRKKWPSASVWRRASNVLTFTRRRGARP